MTYQSRREAGAVRILVAESRPDVRSALKLLLEQDVGMVVSSEAKRGGDVLEQVKETCPDVIILDCDLPGLQIRDLLRAVRSVCPGVWVVAMCARSEARQAALSAGADAFVSKADPPQSLLDIIRQRTMWGTFGGSGNATEK
ncbi:MAG: response regulator transcription factor [Dehalococcoidia bacterium]|nr:response regulator transcription factor [Dehalococcoidia bacterium]